MELEHITVVYRMRNGIGVQLLFKNALRGFVGFVLVFTDFLGRVLVKDWGSCKAEKLGIGKKLFDGFVILTKLRTVALIKNENDTFIP